MQAPRLWLSYFSACWKLHMTLQVGAYPFKRFGNLSCRGSFLWPDVGPGDLIGLVDHPSGFLSGSPQRCEPWAKLLQEGCMEIASELRHAAVRLYMRTGNASYGRLAGFNPSKHFSTGMHTNTYATMKEKLPKTRKATMRFSE